jgi:hypothetical protein
LPLRSALDLGGQLPDPITTAIATAVAGSVATALTAEAARILKEITTRIRHKLHGDPRAPALPADPLNANGSPEDAARLADLLRQAFQQEPEFAREITALWQDYRTATNVTISNNFNGTAHNSIAIGEFTGNLNLNG